MIFFRLDFFGDTMDKKIVIKLNRFAIEHRHFYNAISFIIKSSAYIFFVMFAVMAIFLIIKFDNRVIRFILVPTITILFNMTIRKIIGRKRPFDALNIKSIVEHSSIGSFPSNHSASAMVIAMAFFYINKIFGTIVIFMAIITGSSRVFAGLHYPSDVIAGFFVGAIFGYVGLYLINF